MELGPKRPRSRRIWGFRGFGFRMMFRAQDLDDSSLEQEDTGVSDHSGVSNPGLHTWVP